MTMADRKELIDILKHCIEDQCNTCPIHFSDGRVTCEVYVRGGYTSMPKAVIQDVIDLLKAQEPKSPIVHTVLGVNYYYCPGCARPIIKSCADGHPRYCEDCGKGLKWE